MRNGALTGARVVLLAGPVVLAFFSGGYFDGPREWAGIVAWALVAVSMIAVRDPLPRAPASRLAIGGLALLAAWTLASLAWAPIADSAYDAGQIAILYAGVLLAATALLRARSALRLVEPALVAGALIVIGYGLSERLLPGLLHFHRSVSAEGRLEQPLTYWNAMGEAAAFGLVLCARLAGDATRPERWRVAAAAAAAPLGLGLYVSFSRGALFAAAAGLVALIVVAPRREQLRAAALAVGAGALAAASSAPLHGVTGLAGGLGTRERQGALALIALALVMVAAALAQRAIGRRAADGPLPLPRHAGLIALVVVGALFGASLAFGSAERTTAPLSGGASRLATLQSNRYAYWRVALHAFGDEPLRGVGAGGWAVYWLRQRPFDEGAQDAHSLYLQTAAELGLIGLALLAAFLGGVAWAARDALTVAPGLAAGPIAGFVVWAAHVALDWDWEMPAVTLTALVLVAALLALSDLSRVGRRARAVGPRPERGAVARS